MWIQIERVGNMKAAQSGVGTGRSGWVYGVDEDLMHALTRR